MDTKKIDEGYKFETIDEAAVRMGGRPYKFGGAEEHRGTIPGDVALALGKTLLPWENEPADDEVGDTFHTWLDKPDAMPAEVLSAFAKMMRARNEFEIPDDLQSEEELGYVLDTPMALDLAVWKTVTKAREDASPLNVAVALCAIQAAEEFYEAAR